MLTKTRRESDKIQGMNPTPSRVGADTATPRPAGIKTSWMVAGLAAACGLAALAAGPGYRFGWWGLGAGLQTMRWAATAAAVVLVLALLSTAMAYRAQTRRGIAICLAAALLSLLVAAPPAFLWLRTRGLPPIHDVSTDTGNPPRYVAVLQLRKGARNSSDYNPAAAVQQRLGYPDIGPADLAVPAAQAFQSAERVARAMGWSIVADVPAELRIEATATTLLFGFKDDIVIRVSPTGAGSRVDMRSLSRIGGGDFGTNASRIRAFINKLRADAAR